MYPHSRRQIPHSRLAGYALAVFFFVSCGGGGSGSAVAAPASAPISATVATAYAKTSETVAYDGKSYGLGRWGAQGLVDMCNRIRNEIYKLAPVVPTETLLASFDVSINEKYFASDKALSVKTGAIPNIPDLLRWNKESNGRPIPATPPNCVLISVELRNATLWRDGKVYRLLYRDKKAIGHPAARIPPLDHAAELFANAPQVHVLDQTCRDIVNPTGSAPGSNTCVWDLFPYVSNLNWPFVLSGRVPFLPYVGLTQTIVPLEAWAGRSIDSSVFEIPSDFNVIVD